LFLLLLLLLLLLFSCCFCCSCCGYSQAPRHHGASFERRGGPCPQRDCLLGGAASRCAASAAGAPGLLSSCCLCHLQRADLCGRAGRGDLLQTAVRAAGAQACRGCQALPFFFVVLDAWCHTQCLWTWILHHDFAGFELLQHSGLVGMMANPDFADQTY